jgi:hypothetical protein
MGCLSQEEGNVRCDVRREGNFQSSVGIMDCIRCPCVLRVEERSLTFCQGLFSYCCV